RATLTTLRLQEDQRAQNRRLIRHACGSNNNQHVPRLRRSRPCVRSRKRRSSDNRLQVSDAGKEAATGDPDVPLDVPNLSVEEITLDVENLRARVSLDARLANLL